MTTKQETIVQAVLTLISGTLGGLKGKVYRSRTEALRREETPAAFVELIGNNPTYGVIDFAEWTLQFVIKIITRGAAPDALADPYVQNFYGLIMADRSLGGLVFDINPVLISYNIQDGDQPVCITEMIFQVIFRTGASDLTA